MLAEELSLDASQSAAALAAIRSVLEADGPPGPRGRALWDLAQRELGAPTRAAPALGEAFSDPSARRVLADVLVIAACIECEVTAAGEAKVRALAEALSVRSPWVELLPSLRGRRVRTIQQALARRSPDGKRVIRRTLSEGGVRGAIEIVTFLLGLHRDPALASRYRALASAPEGSLGRRFFEDFVARGLTFPGEKGGIPERMIHHDLMHVVNGYGTDPAGESELAGFYAGFCAQHGIDGWFTFIVVALATFHLGLPVSPAVVLPARGAFDAERVLASFRRGRRLRVDVMGPWDHWALMQLPLDEARRALGLEGA